MKSMSGREIIDVLEKISELDWYRYKSLNEPEQDIYPPIIVWRFKDMDSERLEQFKKSLKKAIDGFQGNVKWLFKTSSENNNLVLIPSLIEEIEKSAKHHIDTQIVAFIAEKNPEYGKKANTDVPNLAKYIEKLFKNSFYMCEKQGQQ